MFRSLVLSILCALLVVAGSSAAQKTGSDLGSTVDRPVQSDDPVEEVELGPVEAAIAELSLEQKVSQLMIVVLEGLYGPSDADRRLLAELPPGGVVIPQVTTPAHAADYVRTLRSSPIERELGIPLLIGTNAFASNDLVDRPSQVFFELPTLLALSAAKSTDPGRSVATLLSDKLSAMGFNFHFGPSLSLAARLSDTGSRLDYFGSDPRFVAKAAVAFREELARNNIVWVPMGFPGGGANRFANGPAVLSTPRSEVAKTDLLPYAEAIDSGAEVIHVGNTLVPTIDSEHRPASLSRAVSTDLLRELLGFNGLIIAGPLDARDISVLHDPGQAAVLALEAGADMLYWNASRGGVVEAVIGIAAAVRGGRLSQALIDERLRRVIEFKMDHDFLEREMPDDGKAKKLEKDKKANRASFHLERKSVTLVKNSQNVLPLTEEGSMPIGVTGVVGVEQLHDALGKYIKHVVQQPITSARHLGRIQDFEIDRLMAGGSGMRTAVCVLSDAVKADGQSRMISALKSKGMKVVVVLVGQPVQLPKLQHADAILLSYARPGHMDEAMRAVADILVGNAPLELIPAARDLRESHDKELTFDALDVLRSPTGRLPYRVDDQFFEGYAIIYNPTLALHKVKWDFGDGKEASGRQVVHTYKKPGAYPITLTVTDDYGEETSQIYHALIN